MPKPETALVERIRAVLRKDYGLWIMKVHGERYQINGVPDLLCCYRGLFVAFEVKTEGNSTTKLQEITLLEIRKAGGVAVVVRSVQEARSIIDGLQVILNV